MAQFSNYDPARNILSVFGTQMGGYSDGTFINVARTVDTFEMTAGAAGDIVRRRINDKSGTVTITIQQSSPSNAILSAQLALDERNGTGIGPMMFKDLNGLTVASAAIAWIRKYPEVELADSVTGREWMIDCAELLIFVAGSTQLGI